MYKEYETIVINPSDLLHKYAYVAPSCTTLTLPQTISGGDPFGQPDGNGTYYIHS